MSKLKKASPANKKEKFPGYPHYSKKEDIYRQAKEETDLDPENTKGKKAPNVKPQTINEKNFEDDQVAGDLDIPGAELDDDLDLGALEDEENDYYSLGGDEHNNLEEDKLDF